MAAAVASAFPQLPAQALVLVTELQRTSLLWEEAWHSTLSELQVSLPSAAGTSPDAVDRAAAHVLTLGGSVALYALRATGEPFLSCRKAPVLGTELQRTALLWEEVWHSTLSDTCVVVV